MPSVGSVETENIKDLTRRWTAKFSRVSARCDGEIVWAIVIIHGYELKRSSKAYARCIAHR